MAIIQVGPPTTVGTWKGAAGQTDPVELAALVQYTEDEEPGGDGLLAGSISATAGNEIVTIAQVSGPSGGLGSYTRQLYRSTTSGSLGTAISGATSLPYEDTGRENGTPYYYTLRVSDGSQTVYTSQVNATPRDPEAPLTPEELFPNLAAYSISNKQVVGYNDGSVRNSGGNAFGIEGFGNWGTDSSNNPDAITVDTSELSAENPTGSGASLLMKYLPTASPLCGVAAMDGFPGGHRRVLLMGTVQRWLSSEYAPNSWTRGHKNYYVGDETTGGIGPTDYWREWQNPNDANDQEATNIGFMRILPQGDSFVWVDTEAGPPDSLGGDPYPLVRDQWHVIEEVWVAESEVGAGDGEIHVWINGVHTASRTGIPSETVGWNGIEWYATVNDIPFEQWQQIGALYIAIGD